MLVPLYGFLAGDTLGVLVLVHDTQTVRDVAACLEQAAAPRVAPFSRSRVMVEDRYLDPAMTVAQAGLTPLMRIDVVPVPQGARETAPVAGEIDDEFHSA